MLIGGFTHTTISKYNEEGFVSDMLSLNKGRKAHGRTLYIFPAWRSAVESETDNMMS